MRTPCLLVTPWGRICQGRHRRRWAMTISAGRPGRAHHDVFRFRAPRSHPNSGLSGLPYRSTAARFPPPSRPGTLCLRRRLSVYRRRSGKLLFVLLIQVGDGAHLDFARGRQASAALAREFRPDSIRHARHAGLHLLYCSHMMRDAFLSRCTLEQERREVHTNTMRKAAPVPDTRAT